MIAYVYRPKRRKGECVVTARHYFGALQLDGEPREKRWSLGTSDKREAEHRLREERIRCEKEKNGVLPPRPQQEAAERPLVDLLDTYLAELRVLGKTKNTLKKYRYLRVNFTRCGWLKIGDVTPRSFSDWRARSKLAPRTLNAFLKDTGTFFRWLRKERMASDNPLEFVATVDTRRLEKYRRALTEHEVQRLVSSAPHKRAVVYLLAIYTGLRRSEIKQLAIEDFVLDSPAPFVRVRASTAKHPKQSHLRLRPELVEAIRSFLPANPKPSERLFAAAVPRVSTFKRDLEAAGIAFEDSLGRRVDFHALRDTFGTHLAAAGVAPFVLKELMRHSTVQQSEKYYIDATHLPLAAAMELLPKFTVCTASAGQVAGERHSA